jgi:hypothetical protein
MQKPPSAPHRLHRAARPPSAVKTPLHRLVLPFGLVIALAAFAYWTALGYLRFGAWTPEGFSRALFALGAVLLLAAVIRCAQWVADRDGS